MSGALKDFFPKVKKNFNLGKKFKSMFAAGSRILPSRTSKNDTEYQLRLDAGELIGNRYRQIILQINTQAKTPGLRDYMRKHGTHAKLAVAQFDTQAEDEDAEVDRVLDDLYNNGRRSLEEG
ncbi:hypothetical protein FQN54_003463 [Arachnomyces sp. PD_36]|nr:hypothetical protein FQN54_003463 [Arachnomyces sp. PD_36]